MTVKDDQEKIAAYGLEGEFNGAWIECPSCYSDRLAVEGDDTYAEPLTTDEAAANIGTDDALRCDTCGAVIVRA